MTTLFAGSVYKETKFSSKYTIYRLTLSHDGLIAMKPVQKQLTRHGIELSNEDDNSDITFVIAKLAQFKEFVLSLCSITTVVGIEALFVQLHWTKIESLNPNNPATSTRRRTSLVVVSSRDAVDTAEVAGDKHITLNNVDVCIAPDSSYSPAELSFSPEEVLTISIRATGVQHKFSLSSVVCTSPPSDDNALPRIIVTTLPEKSMCFQVRFHDRDVALLYLQALSRAAAVHNIPSYLVDIGWAADTNISVMHTETATQRAETSRKDPGTERKEQNDSGSDSKQSSSDEELLTRPVSLKRRQLAMSVRRPQAKELSPSFLLQLLQEAPVADIGKLGVELNLSGVDLSREKNMAAIGRICCMSVSEGISMLSTSRWTGLFDIMIHEYAMTSRKNITKRPIPGVVEPVHVTSLNMSESGVTPLSLRQLSLCASGLHRIRRLVMCCNPLNIESAAAIASVIRKGALEHLDLTDSHLGDDGVTVLAQALHGNEMLTSLVLAKNNISTSGIGQLCLALPHTSILMLCLASNSLGKTGVHWISNCLQSKCKLQSLDLSHQSPKISPIGAVYLAKALRHNTMLQYLHLQRNRIGSEGARHIAGSLTSNSTLLGLNISRNKVRVSGSLHLGKALASTNRTLEWIVLGERVLPISYLRGEGSANAPTICDLSGKGVPPLVDSGNGGANKFDLGVSSAKTSNIYDRGSVKETNNSEIIIDDEAILISQLLLRNSRLITLKLEEAQLPIQALRGDNVLEENYELDLSCAGLKCCDAIIIGVLVANNSSLTKLNVKGNNFQNTEGEVWLAAALERNPSLNLDTAAWPAEEMYADGYYLLAAMRGVSASGATIEPQRVDSLLYCLFLIFGACSYYADVLSDLYVTLIYAWHPKIYPRGWLVCSIFLLSLPTIIAVYAIVTSLFRHSPYAAIMQILSVVCQIHPLSQVYVSITTVLDFKFLEGVYENIPQLFFQSYVMFRVGITEGAFEVAVLGSILISLTSVSSVLVMVADRGKIRKQSLGAIEDNPKCVQVVANAIACFFGISFNEKHIKNIINYTSYLMSHWFWALCFHCCTLCVRVVALTWLLAGIENKKYIVFLVCFLPRILLVFFLDPRSKHRPFFRNILWTLCYCLLGSVWDKDEKQAILSRKVYLLLFSLCTAENIVFLAYAAFLSRDSHMNDNASASVFGGGVFLQCVCWVLLKLWRLPVHFPETCELTPQSSDEDKLRFICPNTRIRTMEHWYNYLSLSGPQTRNPTSPDASTELVVTRRLNGTRRLSIRKPDDDKQQQDEIPTSSQAQRQRSQRNSQLALPPKRQSIEQRTEPLRRVTALLEYSYFDAPSISRGKQPDVVAKSSSFTWTENPNFA